MAEVSSQNRVPSFDQFREAAWNGAKQAYEKGCEGAVWLGRTIVVIGKEAIHNVPFIALRVFFPWWVSAVALVIITSNAEKSRDQAIKESSRRALNGLGFGSLLDGCLLLAREGDLPLGIFNVALAAWCFDRGDLPERLGMREAKASG
jgi:hypothetical protein